MDSSLIPNPSSSHPSDNPYPIRKIVSFERLAEITKEVFFRYSFSPSRRFEYVNPAISAVTGYTPAEYYQDAELFARQTFPEDMEIIRRVVEEKNPALPVMVRWIHKNGGTVWTEQYIMPIHDVKGRTIAIEGMVRRLDPPMPIKDLREIPQQRKRLLEISQSMIASFSLDEVIRHIIQALGDMLAFDLCMFLVLDPDSNLYLILERIKNELHNNKIRVGVLRPAYTQEYNTFQMGRPALIQAEHKIMVPLHLQETTLGVCSVIRKSGPAFSDEEFELTQIYLAYASLAIENAHLYKESKTRADLITRLVPKNENLNHPFSIPEVSDAIGQEALSISTADRLAVFSYEPDNRLNRLWSKGLSFAYLNHVLTNHKVLLEHRFLYSLDIDLTSDTHDMPEITPIRLLSEAEGFRAVAICPLVYGKRPIACVVFYYDTPHHWTVGEVEALELFSRQAAVALENTRLYAELEETYFQTVLTLARAIDARDSYTADHSRRLADWAEATAVKLNCSQGEVQVIRWAALLHDIGKIGVPDSILRKAGPLTADEWEVMRQHPVVGADIIAPVKKLEPVTDIIRHHQEKFDGSGYPDGLMGEEIPLASRILTVVDAFGAMTDDRVYRKALSTEEAAAELLRCAGTHFDQAVVNVFYELINSRPQMPAD